MKTIALAECREFSDKSFTRFVIHDSAYFKCLNFNLKAGQVFPVHAHKLEGELSIVVIEGEGEFLGDNDSAFAAKTGDILISEIAEPHGVRAITDMRILVTIAPPI